jgi:drug/metabolite transporter (DMT)-like permease
VDRKPLDVGAYSLMVLLTALWGFQQVTIKVIAGDVSLIAQAAIRSIIATLLVLAWARLRGTPLFERDGTLKAGLLAGVLFAVEFVFIYGGLAYTNASRMVVFIYLTPVLTALGLHFLIPGERLHPAQWAGVLVAFGGVVLAFFNSGSNTLIGDLCGIAAAFFWSATTVLIAPRAGERDQDALLSARGFRGGPAPVFLSSRGARRGGGDAARRHFPDLPGGDRRFPELSRVVLAPRPLPRRAALGVLVPRADVRRAVRRVAAR